MSGATGDWSRGGLRAKSHHSMALTTTEAWQPQAAPWHGRLDGYEPREMTKRWRRRRESVEHYRSYLLVQGLRDRQGNDFENTFFRVQTLPKRLGCVTEGARRCGAARRNRFRRSGTHEPPTLACCHPLRLVVGDRCTRPTVRPVRPASVHICSSWIECSELTRCSLYTPAPPFSVVKQSKANEDRRAKTEREERREKRTRA